MERVGSLAAVKFVVVVATINGVVRAIARVVPGIEDLRFDILGGAISAGPGDHEIAIGKTGDSRGASCESVVTVLTRNSIPDLTPAAVKICALIDEPLASPPLPLQSCQTATKRPSASPATAGAHCEPARFDGELAADLDARGRKYLAANVGRAVGGIDGIGPHHDEIAVVEFA